MLIVLPGQDRQASVILIEITWLWSVGVSQWMLLWCNRHNLVYESKKCVVLISLFIINKISHSICSYLWEKIYLFFFVWERNSFRTFTNFGRAVFEERSYFSGHYGVRVLVELYGSGCLSNFSKTKICFWTVWAPLIFGPHPSFPPTNLVLCIIGLIHFQNSPPPSSPITYLPSFISLFTFILFQLIVSL